MTSRYSRIKRILGLFIPLAIVLFSGLLLKFPTLFGLTAEKVSLALMALIGLEFLLERLMYFEKLPDIATALARIDASQKCFGYRGDFGTMEEMIKGCKKEIFLSGLNFNATSGVIGLLEQKAQARVRIKMVAVTVDEALINEVSAYFGEDPKGFRKKLEANLFSFYDRLQVKYPKLVEIRTMGFRPAFGYAAIDPSAPDGFIRVESYTCNSNQVSRPMMQFRKESSPKEFNVYLTDLESLWAKCKTFVPPSLP